MSVFTRLVEEKRPKVNVSEDSILYKKLKDAIINGGFLADLFDALDKVDEKFYPEIVNNKEQLEEWEKLFVFS